MGHSVTRVVGHSPQREIVVTLCLTIDPAYAFDDHEQHRARQLAREQCVKGVALLGLEIVQREGGEEHMW